jgi:hypothetical protein
MIQNDVFDYEACGVTRVLHLFFATAPPPPPRPSHITGTSNSRN